MSDAHTWVGDELFIGRVCVGSIATSRETPDAPFTAHCWLPGGPREIGRFPNRPSAARRLERGASHRIRSMFGAELATVAAAVSDGKRLRTIARIIVRAGAWQCNAPIRAGDLMADLAEALGMPRSAGQGVNTISEQENAEVVEKCA